MKFIHFGCWNEGYCDIDDKDKNGMSLVMNSLLNLPEKNQPDFYIVAGDNYYPTKEKKKKEDKDKKEDMKEDKKEESKEKKEDEKEKLKEEKDKDKEDATQSLNKHKDKDKEDVKQSLKKHKKKLKKKIFNEEDLKSGFNCLKDIITKQNNKAYIVMGNHDLQHEDNLYEKSEKSETGDIKLDKCQIISSQLKFEESMMFKEYSIPLDTLQHTVCLFINSILYSDDNKNSIECILKWKPEYHDLMEGDDDNKKIEKIIEKDEEELFSVLDKAIAKKGETIKNIIVVGHDPVITLKTKKKYTLNQNGLDLLEKI